MRSSVGRKLPLPPRTARGGFSQSARFTDVPQKRLIELAKTVDAYIAEHFPRLLSRRVILRVDAMEKELVTSSALSADTLLSRAHLIAVMTAEGKDGAPVELYEPIGGSGSFDEVFASPETIFPELDQLYEKLMDKAEGVRPEAGLKTVVLGGILSGMLAHEAVGHTVEADLVKGGSVAGHNLGKIVASPLVSLTDFAHSAFGAPTPLPLYVDDEGTPAVDAPIIRDGVLVGYLHNRESAREFGMQAQGNARAYAFSDEPLIRMRNTAIHPGSSSLSDMIASVEDGYYLVGTNNGQADTTGEFMFGVNMGYEIKGGRLGRAILDTTISGVAFEMLKTVDMVSDGITWSCSGQCGKKQPMPVGMGGPALRCKIMMGGN
jgi:TldD protein